MLLSCIDNLCVWQFKTFNLWAFAAQLVHSHFHNHLIVYDFPLHVLCRVNVLKTLPLGLCLEWEFPCRHVPMALMWQKKVSVCEKFTFCLCVFGQSLLDSRSLKFIVGLHDRTTKSLLHLHKKKRPPSISAQFQVKNNIRLAWLFMPSLVVQPKNKCSVPKPSGGSIERHYKHQAVPNGARA